MAIGLNIIELQDRLEYVFKDLSILERALTHSSYANEQRSKGIILPSNERLEFLGDSIIQMVISEYLFQNYRKHREGSLSRMRQQIVCEKTLSKIAADLNLGKYINIGNGEELNNCRERPKILADTFEAVIAAIYLDSSETSANICKNVILKLFEEVLQSDDIRKKNDYKTMLQELVEQDGGSILEYKVVGESGPEHNKLFSVHACINNNVVGQGVGSTKRKAEMQAAKTALRLFGVINK